MLNKNSGFLNKSESQILVFDVIAHKWHSQGIYSIVLLEKTHFAQFQQIEKSTLLISFIILRETWKLNIYGNLTVWEALLRLSTNQTVKTILFFS